MAAPDSLKKLFSAAPFNLLGSEWLERYESESELIRYELGARILNPRQMPPGILILVRGEIRLMACLSTQRTITLDRRGPGQMIGWSSLLRSEPCELVQASEPCVCVLVPASLALASWKANEQYRQFFDGLSSPSEIAFTLLSCFSSFNAPPADEENWLRDAIAKSVFSTNESISRYVQKELSVLISFAPEPNKYTVGEVVDVNSLPLINDPSSFSSRYVCVSPTLVDPYQRSQNLSIEISSKSVLAPSEKSQPWVDSAEAAELVLSKIASSEELGLIPLEKLTDTQRYPSYTSRGLDNQALSVLKALSERLSLPFPRDILGRILRQQLKRRKTISLELLAILCESLGLQTRIGKIRLSQFHALEWPSIVLTKDSDDEPSRPLLLHNWREGKLIAADPQVGLVDIKPSELIDDTDSVRVLLVEKTKVTKVDRFGWRWFTPLLRKFKWSLLIVLLATFATQLATLAIPLLMQQIIDKTLSQGNISSLNVLGGSLVVIALFQALMTALRTFVFKDTADRMDLQLGATVIDRLLRLPLPYFDKRPVGELSQRLGEMKSIRGFLTGNAITSLMDMIFSVIYLVVMFLYSPLLTVVALSTFPVYVVLVVVVAPLYKSLIRRQAVASARTQSHVIEVLGAIQTVKAQNVELMSRWKWQDRYQGVVEEGFKAVTVGTVSGQIGSFLNTLSSLLTLWVGMIQVIDGNLTLGQLIAFRIIAGYVTGPLLRLSNLYQGFQRVSLSFERLGDIINQQPEANASTGQIALPPIEGDVRYDDLSFRFTDSGPLILDSVSLRIRPGQFVGIAGLSGSGKSTLMKLLGRLYDPHAGRIVVDGYDIAKVDLGSLRQQIGIVPQDSLLFEGTVKENIALGRPEADTDSIIDAAKVAVAHDFIMDLPDGYNTSLSEKGSNLSGGQRQRLSIARTLLNEPRMLVMDEATSALDFQTEAQVCENLRHDLNDRTVFFITHRLGTIRQADLILMMHQGRVVEQGTHNQLMELKGRYYALYLQQEAAVQD